MPRWLDFQNAPLGLRHSSNSAASAKQKPAYFPASIFSQISISYLTGLLASKIQIQRQWTGER